MRTTVEDSNKLLHLVCHRCHAIQHMDETLPGNLHECLQEQHDFTTLPLAWSPQDIATLAGKPCMRNNAQNNKTQVAKERYPRLHTSL